MIRFAAPEWALLLPALAVVAWRWKSCRHPLRLACLLLLLLLLTRPQLRQSGRGLDLWVLADRSASGAASVEPRLAEWQRILEQSRGRDDRLFVIDYAAEAILRDRAAGAELTGGREATRTALAVDHALSLMKPDRAARLLLLGDGYATEPLAPVTERLLRQQTPLDYRLATEADVVDFRVDTLSTPARAQPGEPFLVELRVSGPGGGKAPFEITRDGRTLTRGVVEIPAGRGSGGHGVARFTDKVATPGGHRYSVRITPAHDAHAGNNEAAQWLEITGGPRLLLVTGYRGDPLAQGLRAHGFEVEIVGEGELAGLDAGRLQGARAVILNNVAAPGLPRPFLEALDFFVRHQGGGLLMAGGKSSFASGAYFGSPIAELLPVSMELRNEHRKLAVALAIVLDRSGSMSMAAAGGTKMDLADAGAARAVELLGPMDSVTVLAVDTKPHEIVPLSTIGSDGGKLGNTVRRITSGGGGIFVYTGLKAAYDALAKAPRGQRHVILFADAADAEEPGDYQALLKKMGEEGMTVSVIGLGTERDSDADFLKDVALRGKSRIFFTTDAGTLPALFEQETVAVARSAFIEEETALKPMAGWAELAARPLQWPGAVDGYNLSYLRPGATAAAVTGDAGDGEPAPLVSFWQRGSGRVAAVSFPLGGDFSGRVRAWPGFGDFSQTLARWLMGETLLPGIALRASVDGSELSADLLFDPSWEATIAGNPPELLLAATPGSPGAGPDGKTVPLVWERMEPGRYRATAPLAPGQLVRGAVRIGKSSLPFGPLLAGAGAEWALDPAKSAELAAVSRASGGSERLDLSTVWKAPRRAEFAEIRLWILPVLLLLFLAETLLTRLGRIGTGAGKITRPDLSGWKFWPHREALQASPPPPPPHDSPRPSPAAASPEETPMQTPPVPEAKPSRRERFHRAKRR